MLADYARAFAFEREKKTELKEESDPILPPIPKIEYSTVTLPDPWELMPANLPRTSFSATTLIEPLFLLPPAGLKNAKAKEKNPKFTSRSKQLHEAKTQKGKCFSSMRIGQLKQEASSWNKLHSELKIVNLGRLSKQQLIERLTALTA